MKGKVKGCVKGSVKEERKRGRVREREREKRGKVKKRMKILGEQSESLYKYHQNSNHIDNNDSKPF